MHVAGSPSWRLRVNNAQMLDHALYVRDAVGLVVPSIPEAPPDRLIGIPDRGGVLSDVERAVAGSQWLSWWRRLVAFETTPRPPRRATENPGTWFRRGLAERQRIFDPPSFAALNPWPALRTAVLRTSTDARDWTNRATLPEVPHDSSPIDWTLADDVAESMIADRGLRPDQIDGTILLLDAPGTWSYVAPSGIALCTVAVAGDPVAAAALLRNAFSSGLGA